jgi:S-methylmethionine-dependent homocysteine/selenocysteine methylase
MFATEESPLLIDGGVATELERGGIPVAAPWWTTGALATEEKRHVLREIHAAYLAAGARVISANTFRCNRRALDELGLDGAGRAWMVHAAVGVAIAARNEASDAGTLIAGSMAPVEDCYRPDLVPPDDELRGEHRWLATEMLRAGIDVVLIETMNTTREARIALEEVQTLGGRAWVSFVCGADARLLSGESVADAARAVESDGAEAVLVNCTPVLATELSLAVIGEACDGPVGAYPNLERRGRRSDEGPEAFAATLVRWHDELGASILGGCCGTRPEHVAALRDRLAMRSAA